MDLDRRMAELAALMEERLGTRGAGLEAKLSRVGRRLPRRLKREAALLVEAKELGANPKLVRRVDDRRLKKAARALERHLETVDASERRTTFWIRWLAGNAASFGFYNLPSEPWHWSTTGS